MKEIFAVEEKLLPKEYKPFRELVICGNTFENGQVPIKVDGHPVFLLGKGDEANKVNVWLQVPTGKEWEYQIRPGHLGDSAYEVKRSGNLISVYFGHHIILRAEIINDDKVVIDHLDFTKWGLMIHGDPKTLWVGKIQISNNRFQNVNVMVNVR